MLSALGFVRRTRENSSVFDSDPTPLRCNRVLSCCVVSLLWERNVPSMMCLLERLVGTLAVQVHVLASFEVLLIVFVVSALPIRSVYSVVAAVFVLFLVLAYRRMSQGSKLRK